MKLLSVPVLAATRLRRSYWVTLPASVHLIGLGLGLVLAACLFADVYLGYPLRVTISMLSACAVTHLVLCGTYTLVLALRAKILEDRARREAVIAEIMDS